MSDKDFFDTNILIYATLADDPRAKAARALLASGGVISVQVLNEFASVSHRKLKRSWAEVTAVLAAMRRLCPTVQPIDLAAHDAAMTLARQGGFSFYDALIVACALRAGCRTLWSEDFQDGRVIDGRITIRNPFPV